MKDARQGARRMAMAWFATMGGVMALFAVFMPAGAVGPVAQTDQVRDVAARLYLQNCASCHGVDGAGAAGGPTLIGVGAASADFYLRTGRMPLGAPDQQPVRQEPIFDEDEIQALVAYVEGLGEGPAIPQVRSGGDVRRGWELYQANCAACHGASGTGNAVGGGSIAVGLNEATPVQIAEAMQIGPGVMPRFDYADEDRDAIISYLDFQRNAPNPGGAPVGGFGPVSEGFVAFIVGLVLVLLAVRAVGRGSHEGTEPVPVAPSDDAGTVTLDGTGS